MRYQAEHKQEAKAKLLEAAGRGFRRLGYGGIGVDGLAKEAGVTSGAFYGHFKSKDAAFGAAALAGLDDLRAGIAGLQDEQGARWAEAFIAFYLGERLTCGLDASCGLQSLTPDVTRASEATKASYGAALERVARQIAKGLQGSSEQARLQKAWALMALLSGGVTMARSVASREARDAIAAHLKQAALALL
ncbi:TetR family transcriptional regulator [Bradyrhizobium oligotrophicum S58]|uniref:TetR family transcriptional regulator n=1 Tax=Bradyrhizobium oligotrophicum S58 TaxID=1245469 RepID=M4ZYL6_9BRAD|nr:TetR/AcrR family transcriptional regulator [Bradyrhizobium oligotrophicum]BAM91540.1 TetR family transcriptional regulator [Bradyrhizobium oligotrophicum S58]